MTATCTVTALDWFRTLYPDDRGGHMVLWTRQDKRSEWFSLANLDGASARAVSLAATKDVYFGIGLHPRQLAPDERGRGDGVSALPGLWLDLDVAGPAHQGDDLPPDRESARLILDAFPLSPTVVVDSGHGLQAWWLFPELWRFQSEAERQAAKELSRRFQATLVGIGRRMGWHVDSTHDLARVLRVPGTMNRKLTPVPVEVVDIDLERRYRPEDFEPHLVAAETVRAPAPPVEGTIAAQHRNTTLTSLAGTMRRRGMSEDAITAALMAENATRCDPPLPDAEVRAIAASVATYAPQAVVVTTNGHGWEPLPEPPEEDDAADYDFDDADGASGVHNVNADPADADDLFRIYTPAELLDADRSFKWLLRGLLVHPSYGQAAGEKKTLKSYLLMFINLAVASGTPLFGQFDVDEAIPVVTYVGEGGRIPYTRRLERVAHAMGLDLRHLPLYSSFDVAAVQSPRFAETLRRDLRDRKPGLVALDPLYAFHGAAANSSNLHEEGALLSSMSTPCINAGASLLVANHFNKTGGGRGLDRITQAGSQEWADTWLLLSHREAPDVTNGQFKLLLEVGSRQWGGTEWDLDLNVGRFDVELGEFDGDISWDLRRHRDPMADSLEAKVVKLIAAHPFHLTKEELAKGIGGNLQHARAFISDLETKGAIGIRQVTRERSDGRQYSVWAFGLIRAASDPETSLDAEGGACT